MKRGKRLTGRGNLRRTRYSRPVKRLSDQTTIDGVYQGAPGAFSEDAARAMLGANAELQPCATLEEVFAALCSGTARSAVVPIDNSIAGPVPGCAELMSRHDVTIVSERRHRIVHALVAPAGVAMSSVRRVLSHPVALAQCGRFLQAHPFMTPVRTFDTAGALGEIIVNGWTDAAAIASRRAVEVYGGTVLADGIQDVEDNLTRFLLLEKRGTISPDLLRK